MNQVFFFGYNMSHLAKSDSGQTLLFYPMKRSEVEMYSL